MTLRLKWAVRSSREYHLELAISACTCFAALSSKDEVLAGVLMIFSIVGSNTSPEMEAKLDCPGASARAFAAWEANALTSGLDASAEVGTLVVNGGNPVFKAK